MQVPWFFATTKAPTPAVPLKRRRAQASIWKRLNDWRTQSHRDRR